MASVKSCSAPSTSPLARRALPRLLKASASSRLEPDGLGVILQRAVHVAFGAARNAPVVKGRGIVRLEPDGLGVILQRAVHVAFVAARKAPVVEGGGMVRLEAGWPR